MDVGARHDLTALRLFLKDMRAPDQIAIDISGLDDDGAFGRIRCPLCRWRPSASSRWCCYGVDTPETPPFEGCGAVWNSFATAGRCPGCGHQWRWTSCLRCHEWSLHGDWYDDGHARPGDH